jgi:thioredoxin
MYLSAETTSSLKEITNINDFNSTVNSSQNLIVKFTANWCSICKNPIFHTLANQPHKGVDFVVVDITEAEGKQVAKSMKNFGGSSIQGLPTFVFIKNQKEVKRIVGLNNLQQEVDAFVAQAQQETKAIIPVQKEETTTTVNKDATKQIEKEPKTTKTNKDVVHKKEKKSKTTKKYTTIKTDTATTQKQAPKKESITPITTLDEIKTYSKNSSTKPVIVKFYTDWCGMCKKIEPTFANLAKDYHSTITFASVECDMVKEATKEYSIEGYPTFIAFHNGKEMSRTVGCGEKSLEALVKKLDAITNAPAAADTTTQTTTSPKKEPELQTTTKKLSGTEVIKTITTQAELNNFIKSQKPTIVKFFAEWCGPCRFLQPTYVSLAESNQDAANFLEVNVDSGADLARAYNINSIPHIKFFKNGKEVDYMSGGNKTQLEKKVADFLKK